MAPRRSGWINLQDYIAANAGQGDAMAQRVTDDVGKQVGEAQSAIQKAQGTFGKQTTAAQNDVETPFSGAGTSADAAKRAGQVYKAPGSLEDVDPTLSGKVRDAAQRVNNLKTSSGAFAELQKTYGGQSKGGLAGALDSLLIQGSPQGSAALSGAGAGFESGYVDALGASQKQGASARAAAKLNAGKWAELSKKLRGQEWVREDAAQLAKLRGLTQGLPPETRSIMGTMERTAELRRRQEQWEEERVRREAARQLELSGG